MRSRKVTHLNRAQSLTSAVRMNVFHVQDLCIEVSLHSPTHVADCSYDGNTHQISVRVVPRTNLDKADGGNGTFSSDWSDYLYLPGHPRGTATPGVAKALAALCLRLQALLPPSHTPGGAA